MRSVRRALLPSVRLPGGADAEIGEPPTHVGPLGGSGEHGKLEQRAQPGDPGPPALLGRRRRRIAFGKRQAVCLASAVQSARTLSCSVCFSSALGRVPPKLARMPSPGNLSVRRHGR
jgi:hypothetical protein